MNNTKPIKVDPTPQTVDLEKFMPRCKTKDTHDFPELVDDNDRCWNCQVWELIDKTIAEAVNKAKTTPRSGVAFALASSPTGRHKHIIPCEDCGSQDWLDWVLLPHELFNQTCPGGNGYLCFNCFIKRTKVYKKLERQDNES